MKSSGKNVNLYAEFTRIMKLLRLCPNVVGVLICLSYPNAITKQKPANNEEDDENQITQKRNPKSKGSNNKTSTKKPSNYYLQADLLDHFFTFNFL